MSVIWFLHFYLSLIALFFFFYMYFFILFILFFYYFWRRYLITLQVGSTYVQNIWRSSFWSLPRSLRRLLGVYKTFLCMKWYFLSCQRYWYSLMKLQLDMYVLEIYVRKMSIVNDFITASYIHTHVHTEWFPSTKMYKSFRIGLD